MSDRKYDPRVPFDVWLSAFDDWPADQRPVFRYRRMSAAEFNTLADAVEELEQTTEPKQRREKMFEVCVIGLLGWERQINPTTETVVEFDPDKIQDVMSFLEAEEIFRRRTKAITLTAEDKKKLESQGSSSSDSSAESVSPASAA